MRNLGTRFSLGFPISQTIRRRFQAQLRVEQLEARMLLAVYPLGPAQVRHAYGFDQLTANGAGQTIALVDAYDAPNIFKDLDTFDKKYSWNAGGPNLYSQFGASSSFLTKATPQGKPRANSGWAQEISLDVEWAHAVAPAASILLVEARTNSLTNLLSAVDYAASQPGVVAVSMSWGSAEFSGETSYDSHFTQTGVTFVASSGDSPGSEWPAVSPNVLAVGGTSLTVDSSGNYGSESAWNNQYGASGGGISPYESKPSYQSGVTQSSTQRTSPDVAYNGDPVTGFAVYDSYFGGGGWGTYGGTSAGAPQWAALLALANQGRATRLSSSGTLSALYAVLGTASYGTYFHDVVGNGATAGYDVVTGLGTPKADALVPYLQGAAASAVVTAAADGSTGGNGKKPPPAPPPDVGADVVDLTPVPIVALPTPVVIVAPTVRLPEIIPPVAAPIAVSQPVQLRMQHQESGGGNNAILFETYSDPETTDDNADSAICLENAKAPAEMAARAAAGYVRQSPANADAVPSWKQVSTACFAYDPSLAAPAFKLTQDGNEAPSASPTIDQEQVIQPGAALAAMGFLLGGYWGRQSEEPESEKRRRTGRI